MYLPKFMLSPRNRHPIIGSVVRLVLRVEPDLVARQQHDGVVGQSRIVVFHKLLPDPLLAILGGDSLRLLASARV